MERYFGTDGIRGIANGDLTPDIAFKCGNALARLRSHATLVVGRDTRSSGDMIMLNLAGGATAGGATVLDVGIVPTAGIAYLTRHYNADFGVVISASHNPYEFNGIKVFDRNGYKLTEKDEMEIENNFRTTYLESAGGIGRYYAKSDACKIYENSLLESVEENLSGLRIVMDCSNGASFLVAPNVFRRLGADVVTINCESTGERINENCGSLHPEQLSVEVVKRHADIGFAYDGDSDRLIAVDELGNIIDGDILIYILACHYQKVGCLVGSKVVGTSHTNMGIQKALENKGMHMLRSDIGDKYVIEMMLKENVIIGGEQSGHIILRNYSTTGDGILSSLQVSKLVRTMGKKLSELNDVTLYPQTNLNIRVKEKLRILNNEELSRVVTLAKDTLAGKGRVMVRASGTEPIIRVFAECEDAVLAKNTAENIAEAVRKLDE